MSDMNFFTERDQQFRQSVPDEFYRHLFHEFSSGSRCTIVIGPDGAGKTTLLLQIAEYHQEIPADLSLFVSAGDLWLREESLFEIAELFYLNGGRYLFVDDIHLYADYPGQVSKIVDELTDLTLIITSSIPPQIDKNITDDVVCKYLPPLSFREYLGYRESIRIDSKKLGEIISFQKEVSEGIAGLFQPIPPFRRYLAGGTLLAPKHKATTYPGTRYGEQRVRQFIECTLPAAEGIDFRSVTKIEQLLALIIRQGQFKPNISNLARHLDVSRDSIYAWLRILEECGLIHRLWLRRPGHTRQRKPYLILAGDPALLQFAGNQPDDQTLRVTFLVSQLKNAGFTCSLHQTGAIYLNGMTIATGDRNEPIPDVSDGSHPLVAADNLEVGEKGKIPLWMFGLLY